MSDIKFSCDFKVKDTIGTTVVCGEPILSINAIKLTKKQTIQLYTKRHVTIVRNKSKIKIQFRNENLVASISS